MCRSSARATLFPYTTLFRSNFAAGTMGIPYFGLFSACATSMESLALSAFMINSHGANYILSGSSSHNAAAEKQFRYPNDYGCQIIPTAQRQVKYYDCNRVSNLVSTRD